MLYSLPISKYIKLYNTHTGKWNISAPMNTVTALELDAHINCSYIAGEGYFTLLLVRWHNTYSILNSPVSGQHTSTQFFSHRA